MAKSEAIKKQNNAEDYSVSLVFPYKTYKVRAKTILACLELLKPDVVKGKCLLRVEKDGKKSEMAWYPFRLRKLLNNPILRQITEKRMNLSLR